MIIFSSSFLGFTLHLCISWRWDKLCLTFSKVSLPTDNSITNHSMLQSQFHNLIEYCVPIIQNILPKYAWMKIANLSYLSPPWFRVPTKLPWPHCLNTWPPFDYTLGILCRARFTKSKWCGTLGVATISSLGAPTSWATTVGIHLFTYFWWSKDSELNVHRGLWGRAQTGNGG